MSLHRQITALSGLVQKRLPIPAVHIIQDYAEHKRDDVQCSHFGFGSGKQFKEIGMAIRLALRYANLFNKSIASFLGPRGF